MRYAAIVVLVLTLAACTHDVNLLSPSMKPTAATQPSSYTYVKWSDLDRSAFIVGPLGKSMGTYMTIRGRVLTMRERPNDYWSQNIVQNLFEGQWLNNEVLPKPWPLIDLRTREREPLPVDGPIVAFGYED